GILPFLSVRRTTPELAGGPQDGEAEKCTCLNSRDAISVSVEAGRVVVAGYHPAGRARRPGRGESPLLLMLHLAWLFLPRGLAASAAGAARMLPAAGGPHLPGIGAAGGMTIAAMMRATRGHMRS